MEGKKKGKGKRERGRAKLPRANAPEPPTPTARPRCGGCGRRRGRRRRSGSSPCPAAGAGVHESGGAEPAAPELSGVTSSRSPPPRVSPSPSRPPPPPARAAAAAAGLVPPRDTLKEPHLHGPRTPRAVLPGPAHPAPPRAEPAPPPAPSPSEGNTRGGSRSPPCPGNGTARSRGRGWGYPRAQKFRSPPIHPRRKQANAQNPRTGSPPAFPAERGDCASPGDSQRLWSGRTPGVDQVSRRSIPKSSLLRLSARTNTTGATPHGHVTPREIVVGEQGEEHCRGEGKMDLKEAALPPHSKLQLFLDLIH